MRATPTISLPLLFMAISLLAGCSSVNSMFGGNSKDKALQALKWSYAKDAITLHLNAGSDLNQDGDQPHTLLLAVLQMENPNAFTAATSASKLSALLVADGAPNGFLALDRVFVNPGQQCSVSLARVENAQYVGVVAGYYTLDPKRVARLYRIGVQVDSSGHVVKSRTAKPAPLLIELKLGTDGIVGDDQQQGHPPPKPSQPQAGQVKLKNGGTETCGSSGATAMGEVNHNAT